MAGDEINGKPISSEQLHNRNCYSYLKIVTPKIPNGIMTNIQVVSPDLANKLTLLDAQKKYDPSFAYADLYTQFFTVIEGHINTIIDNEYLKIQQKQAAYNKKLLISEEVITQELVTLDAFIDAIYANDNHILEQTYTAIQQIPLSKTLNNPEIEQSINWHLKDDAPRVNINSQSPAEAGSAYSRFTAMIAEDFKPQHRTNLATVRQYNYTQNALKEYRFGTQGQRDKGVARVSPLFERWLKVQARIHPKEDPLLPITHVYINNLGLDRTGFAGKKERELTLQLHRLEERHNNIAVITLPADKGLMDRSAFKNTHDHHDPQEVYKEFLLIATQDSTAKNTIKDFKISDKIREALFKNENGTYSKESEKAHMTKLLDQSYQKLGIAKTQPLSSAQRQAVWFHFIKFELTNHILEHLKPVSVNFSCKDAIDRGGVSSAYYNLIKSIEQKNPLSREEFDKGLHAAPAMVKARGMNHHLKLIWNAVDAYLNEHYKKIEQNPKEAWMIEWRDLNCPHARVNDLLSLRINQIKEKLTNMPNSENTPQIMIGRQIITLIEKQKAIGVSGKGLLLETVSRTQDLLFNPCDQDKERNAKIEHYGQVADQLIVKYPTLQKLAGLMKMLVGAIAYAAGYAFNKQTVGQKMMHQGYDTFKAAEHSKDREQIVAQMKQMKTLLDDMKIENKPAKKVSDEFLDPPITPKT
jgi:hypothetical protein